LKKFKKKTARIAVFKLMAQSIHNLLHAGIPDQLKHSIEEGVTMKATSHTSLKKLIVGHCQMNLSGI
jgi:hypothetical protein